MKADACYYVICRIGYWNGPLKNYNVKPPDVDVPVPAPPALTNTEPEAVNEMSYTVFSVFCAEAGAPLFV